ncbi:MAG: LLM class flavin-dependent oxidoreductase, partial [Acidimicrobiales bacterium]
TEDALLGTCVLQLPLRHVPELAKTAAAVQTLSAGRFVLGVGVGSHRGEYEAAGSDFHRRGVALDDALDALRREWKPDSDGRRYRQLPVPPSVPIWVGGASEAAKRRAAQADGWMPLFVSPEEFGAGMSEIRTAAGRSGRDPAAVTGCAVVFVAVGSTGEAGSVGSGGEAGIRWMGSLYGMEPGPFARHVVAGSATQVAERLWRYVEYGAQHVIVFVTDDHPIAAFEDLAGAFAQHGAERAMAPGGGHGARRVRS